MRGLCFQAHREYDFLKAGLDDMKPSLTVLEKIDGHESRMEVGKKGVGSIGDLAQPRVDAGAADQYVVDRPTL